MSHDKPPAHDGGRGEGPEAAQGLRARLRRAGHQVLYALGMTFGFTVPEPGGKGARRGWTVPARPEKRFRPDVSDLLGELPSVVLETRRSPAAPPVRAAIRTVVDDSGRVYSRPREGSEEYWYRRILINPGVMLHTDAGTVYARTARVTDPRTAALVSELYAGKYGADDPETRLLVREDLEQFTVRFEPP